MNTPTVSILLPTNSAVYLYFTLRSIALLELDKISCELILVLDRVSEEGIKKLLEKANLKMQIKIIHSSSPGIVSALNTGLNSASGDYVARIDHDDLLLKERIVRQVDFLEKNSKCVAVGSSVALIDESGNFLGITSYKSVLRNPGDRLFLSNPLAHPAVMYRKSIALEVGGYRENVAEDWDLWIRMLNHGFVGNILKPLTAYRVHSQQLSRNDEYNLAEASRKLAISHALSAIQAPIDNPAKIPSSNWLQFLSQDEPLIFEQILRRLNQIERSNKVPWKANTPPTIPAMISYLYTYFFRRILNLILKNIYKGRVSYEIAGIYL